MYTLAILSNKGGAGKTTLALHLAAEATRKRKAACVVDLDPQASATVWYDNRDGTEPPVISCQAARLPNVHSQAENEGVGFLVIDTAPHSEANAMAAAQLADLVLIPCRVGFLDLMALERTLQLVKLAGARAAFVLNAAPVQGTTTRDFRENLEGYGYPVVAPVVHQRAAFGHALAAIQTVQEYEPESKAASEIAAVYKWIQRHG